MEGELTDLSVAAQPANEHVITVQDADWLDQLTESVLDVVVEYASTIRELYIYLYWEIGQCIVQEIERQKQRYEDDQLLPEEQRTVDPPASKNYIITNLEGPLLQHDKFLGSKGKTTLYEACAFYEACPTEEKRDTLLEVMAKTHGKALTWRDICRGLLEGPVEGGSGGGRATLYTGAGKVFGNYRERLVTVIFPMPEGFSLDPGAAVKVRVTKLS